MAQPDLIFFKKKAFLVKPEVTPGTDSTPTAMANGFRLFDGSSTTEFDKVERMVDKPHFGNDPFGVANKRVKIEGDFELYPPLTPGAASTSDADAGVVLKPCGLAVTKNVGDKTTRYTPVSSAIPSVCARWYHGRKLVAPTGMRGDVSGLAMEIGKRFMGKLSLLGDYVVMEKAASIPAVTLPAKVPVIATSRNTTLIVGTLVRGATASTDDTPLEDLHLRGKMLSVDFGGDLKHKEYTEFSENSISERKGTFSMRIAETDLTDDFNPWHVRDNGIVMTGEFRLFEDDTKDGLYSALGVRCQIENITEVDIEGDKGYEFTGPCIPSDAGGDDFYVEFGDLTV